MSSLTALDSLRQGLLLYSEFFNSAIFTSQLALGSPCLLLLIAGIVRELPYVSGFCVGAGDLDLCPYACMVSPVSTEPFLHPSTPPYF